MGDFCVTGVYKIRGKIRHVLLHNIDNSGIVYNGDKKPIEHIIKLLKQCEKIEVLMWNYDTGKWISSSLLKIVNTEAEIVKSHNNHIVNDDFDKLMNLQEINA